MTDVTVTLRKIRRRIATAMVDSGRNPADIRLVAVSKTHSPDTIRQAIQAGLHEFAENYLQEATVKIQALRADQPVWHYIGRIQANKTRDIASCFDWVQTVDRARVITRLASQRPDARPPLNICLQVRLSDDPARPGAAPEELPRLAELTAGQPRLRLRGLMCMPPPASETRPGPLFEYTRALYEQLRASGFDLDTLSMGTTADFEQAIAAGSTLVRIGTALFGPRS